MGATIEFCAPKSEADALCNRLNSELEDAEIAENNAPCGEDLEPSEVTPRAINLMSNAGAK